MRLLNYCGMKIFLVTLYMQDSIPYLSIFIGKLDKHMTLNYKGQKEKSGRIQVDEQKDSSRTRRFRIKDASLCMYVCNERWGWLK